MSLIKRLTPTNLLEEKKHFLADTSYNPQFTYAEPISEDDLYKYGYHNPNFVELAQEILDRAYFSSNELDLRMNQGRLYSEQEVTDKAYHFLQMHDLEEKIKIMWSSSFVSRASINSESLKLRTGSEFRKENLLGMLYHEIGTHAIRRANYEKQPWFRKKKKHGFSSYLKTEEGLASLHSLLPITNKSAYSTAIRYVASNFAQQHSFAETWNLLSSYLDDTETRWMVCLRQKRGMTDTSKPGGFTKDLVYFEGMVKMYHWLKQHDFDLTTIYFGKLSYKDVDKAKELNPDFEPLLPSFFTLDKDQYAQQISSIGQTNQFDQVDEGILDE
jgi:hypothetical protein